MNKMKIVGIITFLLQAAGSGFYFAITRSGLPVTEGSIFAEVKEEAKIYRDEYGNPHIEAESFKETYQVHEYLVEGEFIEKGDGGVVIGQQLADMLELEVGEFYTLHFQDDTGAFNTLQGEIM